jgi:hypothetical protein
MGVLAAALLLAACGGGTKPLAIPGNADPKAEHVIDDWVNALRMGDVEKASSYFALPSIAENGPPPLRIANRAAALAFNRSLPCGARLIAATRAGRFTAATFRLTNRPGGACGPGVGGIARTAFVIRNGKILEWRRLPDRPRPSAPSGPIV